MKKTKKKIAHEICDTPEPSHQVLRPSDSGYLNIDRLAEDTVRTMGYTGTEYGLQVVNIQNLIFTRARQGSLRLYREDKLLPFHLDGIESLHGGLRLTQVDANKIRTDLLGDAFVDASATASTQESDPPRRLAALRALGGDVRWWRSEWKIKGITELEAQEKAQKRPRSDQKTIRADLKKAAEDERQVNREGRPAVGFPGI